MSGAMRTRREVIEAVLAALTVPGMAGIAVEPVPSPDGLRGDTQLRVCREVEGAVNEEGFVVSVFAARLDMENFQRMDEAQWLWNLARLRAELLASGEGGENVTVATSATSVELVVAAVNAKARGKGTVH